MASPVTHDQIAARPGGTYVVARERGAAGLIDAIADEWAALCAEGPCDEPFYGPAWVRAWGTAFAPETPLTLVTVRRDGALRAILPLVERSIGAGPVKLRWLHTAANSHFPRFDVIHGAGDRDEVIAALWEFFRTWSGWDLIQFESAPDPGVVWSLLEGATEAGYPTRYHRPDASPYVDVARFPRGIDEIVTTRPIKLRSQLRRSLKRLRGMGEVEFRIIGSDRPPEEIQEAVDTFYHQEASGWKGEAGTAILSDPATKAFYDRVVADARESGTLAICQLWCDSSLVAAKIELIQNGRMYELKSSYDERYGKVSPGHLLKAYALDAAPDLGVQILDNCGRADDHKLAWTDLSHPFATCFLFNRTPRGRLVHFLLFQAGPVVRERLPHLPVPSFVKRALA